MNFNHTTCCESRHPVSTFPVPETTITSQTAEFNCRIQSGLFLTCILFLLAYYSTLLSPWFDSTMSTVIFHDKRRYFSFPIYRAGLLLFFHIFADSFIHQIVKQDNFSLILCSRFYDRTLEIIKTAVARLKIWNDHIEFIDLRWSKLMNWELTGFDNDTATFR